MSSGQGLALWLGAAFHVLLLPTSRTRRVPAIWLVVGFVASVWFAASVTELGGGQGPGSFKDLVGLPVYIAQLIGGGLTAAQDPRLAGALGAFALILVGAMAAWPWRGARENAGLRVGLVLVVTSLMMLALFAAGRSRLGIAWALSAFHHAPMLMPFILGAFVLAVELIKRGRAFPRLARVAAGCCLLLIASGFVTASPYAARIGREVVLRRAMAMEASCAPQVSRYRLYGLNNLPDNESLLDRTLPQLQALCGQPVPAWVKQVEAYPPLFARLGAGDPPAEAALEDLWDVYLTHFDLVRAFHVAGDSSARSLLTFAQGNARTGSAYAPEKLKAHEAFFASLRIDDR